MRFWYNYNDGRWEGFKIIRFIRRSHVHGIGKPKSVLSFNKIKWVDSLLVSEIKLEVFGGEGVDFLISNRSHYWYPLFTSAASPQKSIKITSFIVARGMHHTVTRWYVTSRDRLTPGSTTHWTGEQVLLSLCMLCLISRFQGCSLEASLSEEEMMSRNCKTLKSLNHCCSLRELCKSWTNIINLKKI